MGMVSCVYLCLLYCAHEYGFMQRLEESTGSPDAGVIGCCVSLKEGPGNPLRFPEGALSALNF